MKLAALMVHYYYVHAIICSHYIVGLVTLNCRARRMEFLMRQMSRIEIVGFSDGNEGRVEKLTVVILLSDIFI